MSYLSNSYNAAFDELSNFNILDNLGNSAWEADVLPLNDTRKFACPIVYSDDSTVTNSPI